MPAGSVRSSPPTPVATSAKLPSTTEKCSARCGVVSVSLASELDNDVLADQLEDPVLPERRSGALVLRRLNRVDALLEGHRPWSIVGVPIVQHLQSRAA